MSIHPSTRSGGAGQLGEIRRGYPILLPGVLSIAVAMPTISIYTFPYFMAAFKAEFGWERQQVGLAVGCLTRTICLVGPRIGRLIDRYGVRRIATVSIVLYAAGLAALSQITASIWTLYAGYVLLALLGMGASHPCYCGWWRVGSTARAESHWVTRHAGLHGNRIDDRRLEPHMVQPGVAGTPKV